MTENKLGDFDTSSRYDYSFNFDTAGTEGATIDVDVFEEGTDSIDTYKNIALRFEQPRDYQADLTNPVLAAPTDENYLSSLNSTEKQAVTNIVSRTHRDNVVAELKARGYSDEEIKPFLDEIFLSSSGLSPEDQAVAAQVNEEASKKTREQLNLPSSWNTKSSNFEDWMPMLPKPFTSSERETALTYYNQQRKEAGEDYIRQALEHQPPVLTEIEAKTLRKALDGAPLSDPKLQNHLNSIETTATNITKIEFGLPNTWSTTSVKDADWKPINAGPLGPLAIHHETMLMMLESTTQLSNDMVALISKNATGPLSALKTDIATSGQWESFLKDVADALRNLKTTLQNIQLADGEQSKRTSQLKFSMLKAQADDFVKQLAERAEMAAKQLKNDATNFGMKIAGFVVAAVSLIASAIITAVTLGAATPAAIALAAVGMTISLALFAYQIADHFLDLSTQFMKVFKEALDSIDVGIPAVNVMIKVIIVASIIAAIIALIVISGNVGAGVKAGTAGASVAVQTATKVAVQTAMMSIQSMAMTFAMLVIMGSNVVADTAMGAIEAAFPNISKDMKTYIQIAINIVTILVVLALAAKAGGGGGAAAKAVDKTATVAQQGSAQAKTVEQTLKQFAQEMKNFVDNCGKRLRQIAKDTKDALVAPFEVFTLLGPAGRNQAELQRMLSSIERFSKISNLTPTIIRSSYAAANALKMADILRRMGEIEESQAIIEGLIQMIDKLLRSLQGNITSIDDFKGQIDKLITTFFKSESRAVGNLFNASRPA